MQIAATINALYPQCKIGSLIFMQFIAEKNQKRSVRHEALCDGEPWGTRTSGPQLRRLLLYPAELMTLERVMGIELHSHMRHLNQVPMYITLRFENNQLRNLVRDLSCEICLRNKESVLCLVPDILSYCNNSYRLASCKSTNLIVSSTRTVSNIEELVLVNIYI